MWEYAENLEQQQAPPLVRAMSLCYAEIQALPPQEEPQAMDLQKPSPVPVLEFFTELEWDDEYDCGLCTFMDKASDLHINEDSSNGLDLNEVWKVVNEFVKYEVVEENVTDGYYHRPRKKIQGYSREKLDKWNLGSRKKKGKAKWIFQCHLP